MYQYAKVGGGFTGTLRTTLDPPMLTKEVKRAPANLEPIELTSTPR